MRNGGAWHLESTKHFGDNVIASTLVMGQERMTIVGVYIPPSETDSRTLHQLEKALKKRRSDTTIILGDLNVELDNRKDARSVEIAEVINGFNLRNLAKHFKQRGKSGQHWWTWRQIREGKPISAKCDYILGGRDIVFKNFQALQTTFDTDHMLLWAKISYDQRKPKGKGWKMYKQYIKQRKTPNVDLFETGVTLEGTCTGRRCDVIMEELAAEAPKPEYKPRKYTPWISERTLKLGKEKAAAMKKGQEHLVRFISKEIRKNLRKDRKERIRKVAVEIEKRMKGNNVLGAYHIL